MINIGPEFNFDYNSFLLCAEYDLIIKRGGPLLSPIFTSSTLFYLEAEKRKRGIVGEA
jgi:hypothetical protein